MTKTKKGQELPSTQPLPKMVETVTVEKIPTSFSPFSLVDCTLISHFSLDDFITIAFLDLAGDLDSQI